MVDGHPSCRGCCVGPAGKLHGTLRTSRMGLPPIGLRLIPLDGAVRLRWLKEWLVVCRTGSLHQPWPAMPLAWRTRFRLMLPGGEGWMGLLLFLLLRLLAVWPC